MRKWVAIGVLSVLFSCQWRESRALKTQKLVDRELAGINWNEVDAYPLFDVCDESRPKIEQKKCFEDELIRRFADTLRIFEYTVPTEADRTVLVDFMIDSLGKVTVLEIHKDQKIEVRMPEFDGIVTQSLRNLPPMAPALKRGIPVNAKFRVPIVLE